MRCKKLVKVIILDCFANVHCFSSNHFDTTIFFLGYILMASSAVYSLPPRLESKNLRLVLFPLPVVLTTSFDLKIKESFPEDFCF